MKITKKAIKEAPEYIIRLDPKAGGTSKPKANGFYKIIGVELYYKALTAQTLLEAMQEAENYFYDTTYLIDIAVKTGDFDPDNEGIIYKDVLTTRGNKNWHICDKAHCEIAYYTAYNPEFIFFQMLGEVGA